jgi:hypothetical protein
MSTLTQHQPYSCFQRHVDQKQQLSTTTYSCNFLCDQQAWRRDPFHPVACIHRGCRSALARRDLNKWYENTILPSCQGLEIRARGTRGPGNQEVKQCWTKPKGPLWQECWRGCWRNAYWLEFGVMRSALWERNTFEDWMIKMWKDDFVKLPLQKRVYIPLCFRPQILEDVQARIQTCMKCGSATIFVAISYTIFFSFWACPWPRLLGIRICTIKLLSTVRRPVFGLYQHVLYGLCDFLEQTLRRLIELVYWKVMFAARRCK